MKFLVTQLKPSTGKQILLEGESLDQIQNQAKREFDVPMQQICDPSFYSFDEV